MAWLSQAVSGSFFYFNSIPVLLPFDGQHVNFTVLLYYYLLSDKGCGGGHGWWF
jgi:hypothetical protein